MVKRLLNAIGLGAPAAPIPFDTAPKKTVKIGSVGTEVYAGYFSEEYLDKLKGHKLAKEFDKFRRSDPQAKMLLRAVKNPIVAAKWEIEPASDSPEDIADAELVNHILFKDCEKPFAKTVNEALTCVDFGHAVLEKTFKTVYNHPKFGTFHGIESLDLISAKTIERWNFDNETKKLKSITQLADGDLRAHVEIPICYLMLFSLDMEGANHEGVSWLRACYGNYFRKNLYLKLNGIGIEKFAVPTPILKFAQGSQNDEQFNYVLEALEVYTSGQSNYLTIPHGYELELNGNKYEPDKVEASIDKEDARMSKAFLANFLELGMSGTGAYALSNDLSDFFLSGITHIADEVVGVFNRHLIPELVKMNRGPRSDYPKLKHGGISDKAGKELAEIIKLYIDGGVIVPDDQLEETMRRRHNLPKASLIGQRKPAPPAFGGGGFGGPPAQGTLSERVRKKLYG